jgi:hypothetical protein
MRPNPGPEKSNALVASDRTDGRQNASRCSDDCRDFRVWKSPTRAIGVVRGRPPRGGLLREVAPVGGVGVNQAEAAPKSTSLTPRSSKLNSVELNTYLHPPAAAERAGATSSVRCKRQSGGCLDGCSWDECNKVAERGVERVLRTTLGLHMRDYRVSIDHEAVWTIENGGIRILRNPRSICTARPSADL